MSDQEIEQLAKQLVKALGPPLAAMIQQNCAALAAMIRAQQDRNGQRVTYRKLQKYFMTGNGLYG